MDTLNERPIFVVGAPRSGTTLLRYILCSHPHIYIPPESNFIPRFFNKQPETQLQPLEAKRIYQEILGYRVFFKDWHTEKPDPETFISNLPDLYPRTILTALYKMYSQQYSSERWGDKSPIYTEHLALLSQIFPSAQIIHIIRDGRDVALSMLRSYRGSKFFYIDVCYAAHSWKRRVRQARSYGKTLGIDRYHEIRYEELVANPTEVLSAICNFLGEAYEPSMAEPYKEAKAHFHSKGIHAATRQPLTTKSVGRWQSEMSEADQRLFQAIASDLMNELGYQTTELGKMSLAEKARFAQLHAKYYMVDVSRRTLQASGIFHPTSVIRSIKLPYPINRYRSSNKKNGRNLEKA